MKLNKTILPAWLQALPIVTIDYEHITPEVAKSYLSEIHKFINQPIITAILVEMRENIQPVINAVFDRVDHNPNFSLELQQRIGYVNGLSELFEAITTVADRLKTYAAKENN